MAKKPDLYLIVMAGGSGTRFWPKSTAKRPKQLIGFAGGETLISQTLSRFKDKIPESQRWIVTTETLRDAMVNEVGKSAQVLAEPQGRNTAPCIYWAAREVASQNPEAIMLVMPADHFIPRVEDFRKTLDQAIAWAGIHEDLITLGVQPTRPETGYGYLKCGKPLFGNCRKVDSFVEKPNLARAEEFIRDGSYLWNGGMFVWKASTVLEAFDQYMPEMKKAWDSTGGRVEKAYPKLTATSVDFGIMEKASNVVTFPLDCGWDDLGSWTSLETMADEWNIRHDAGVVAAGECIAVHSSGNIVDAEGKFVALLGVDNLIVVESEGRILVAKKDLAQDIRKIVDRVKAEKPSLI